MTPQLHASAFLPSYFSPWSGQTDRQTDTEVRLTSWTPVEVDATFILRLFPELYVSPTPLSCGTKLKKSTHSGIFLECNISSLCCWLQWRSYSGMKSVWILYFQRTEPTSSAMLVFCKHRCKFWLGLSEHVPLCQNALNFNFSRCSL